MGLFVCWQELGVVVLAEFAVDSALCYFAPCYFAPRYFAPCPVVGLLQPAMLLWF